MNDFPFSDEQIKMLAELERDMDSGKIKYVVRDGQRVSVLDEVMEKLGLENGQTISNALFHAMTLANIEMCQKKMDEEGISKLKPADFDFKSS